MSSIERYSRTIPASGVVEHGRGNVLLFVSATGTVNVRAENGGAAEGVNGVNGGVRFERVKPWDNLRILGTPGVTVEYWIGSQLVERDLIDVFTQIATIAGVASFSEFPSAAVATPDDNALPAATTENIAANLLRRRITIGCLSTNDVGFRVQAVGANDASGLEVQPGTFVELRTTASLDIRNNDGALATSYYIFEES